MTTPPGAQEWVPARPSLTSLRTTVQDCRGCELWRDATQAVMGAGARAASLVLVGEQPGDREDLEGLPFVGPAGRILDEALDEAGIDPAEVYRTNAVKHFRFTARGKRRIHESPKRSHVTACRPWLEAELEVIRPTGVVLLGATAGGSVFGPSFRIGSSRGQVMDWPESRPEGEAPWVVATAHPAAVLRSRQRQEDFGRLVDDLAVAARLLGGGS